MPEELFQREQKIAELQNFHDLMPVIHSDLKLPWKDIVTASDACDNGIGVTFSKWDLSDVQNSGRRKERSRFVKLESSKARAHAGLWF